MDGLFFVLQLIIVKLCCIIHDLSETMTGPTPATLSKEKGICYYTNIKRTDQKIKHLSIIFEFEKYML